MVKRPKMAADEAPAQKSIEPKKSALSMGGVWIDQFGEKTLSVEATRPPPDEARPPRMIWKRRELAIAGLEWEEAASTAPVMGNERVRPSMKGSKVSSVAGDGAGRLERTR